MFLSHPETVEFGAIVAARAVHLRNALEKALAIQKERARRKPEQGIIASPDVRSCCAVGIQRVFPLFETVDLGDCHTPTEPRDVVLAVARVTQGDGRAHASHSGGDFDGYPGRKTSERRVRLGKTVKTQTLVVAAGGDFRL